MINISTAIPNKPAIWFALFITFDDKLPIPFVVQNNLKIMKYRYYNNRQSSRFHTTHRL